MPYEWRKYFSNGHWKKNILRTKIEHVQISLHLTPLLLTILGNKTNPIGKYSVSTKTSPGRRAPTNRDLAPSKSCVSGTRGQEGHSEPFHLKHLQTTLWLVQASFPCEGSRCFDQSVIWWGGRWSVIKWVARVRGPQSCLLSWMSNFANILSYPFKINTLFEFWARCEVDNIKWMAGAKCCQVPLTTSCHGGLLWSTKLRSATDRHQHLRPLWQKNRGLMFWVQSCPPPPACLPPAYSPLLFAITPLPLPLHALLPTPYFPQPKPTDKRFSRLYQAANETFCSLPAMAVQLSANPSWLPLFVFPLHCFRQSLAQCSTHLCFSSA